MQRPQRRKTRRLMRTALAWGLFGIGISWLLLAGFFGLTTASR